MAPTVTSQSAMAIAFAFQSVPERQPLDFTQHDVELSCLYEGCSTTFTTDAVHYVACTVDVLSSV